MKDFGNRMVNDHQKANNELKPIAEANGVNWPDQPPEDAQATYERLSRLTGKQVDRQFVAWMVKDHHKVAELYHQESSEASDPNLRAYIYQ